MRTVTRVANFRTKMVQSTRLANGYDRPDFRVVEPGAFRVSFSPGIGAFWIGGAVEIASKDSGVASPH